MRAVPWVRAQVEAGVAALPVVRVEGAVVVVVEGKAVGAMLAQLGTSSRTRTPIQSGNHSSNSSSNLPVLGVLLAMGNSIFQRMQAKLKRSKVSSVNSTLRNPIQNLPKSRLLLLPRPWLLSSRFT